MEHGIIPNWFIVNFMNKIFLAFMLAIVMEGLSGCQTVPSYCKKNAPVIMYCDHGSFVEKPHIIMAAWMDGTIIWQDKKCDRVGSCSISDIIKTLQDIYNSGFFKNHFKYGSNDVLLKPDGRSRSLTVSDGNISKTSFYHEYGVPNYLGPKSNPTRGEAEHYHTMWTNIVVKIHELRPKDSKPLIYDGNKWIPR